jgi:hypothetical protein
MQVRPPRLTPSAIYRRLKSKASDPSSKELEVESPDSRVLLAELFRNKGGAK